MIKQNIIIVIVIGDCNKRLRENIKISVGYIYIISTNQTTVKALYLYILQ